MLIRDKKDWNRYLKKKAEKMKPPRLKEIEKAFKNGTARKWDRETLYGARSYLDRLQISFYKDMETGMMKAANFKIKPFRGVGKLFSAAKGFFSETMKKAAEIRSGKSFLKNPKAGSSAAASLTPKAAGTAPASPKAMKGPQQQGKGGQRQPPPPPSIKVMIIMKIIDLCIWLFKQAGKYLEEMAQVNREVAQLQAGQAMARVRSKF